MSKIAKHHSKQEWECNDREDCWIHLSVVRESVGVHNVLEWLGKIIILEVSRRLDSRVNKLSDLRTNYITVLLEFGDDVKHFHFVAHWDPAQT